MSYYNDETSCPKCGDFSSNPEVCDACGALISRVRERQQAETNTAVVHSDQVTVPVEAFGNRPSLTAVAIVALFAAAGGFWYLKSTKPEPVVEVPVAPAPKRSVLFRSETSPSANGLTAAARKPVAAQAESKARGDRAKEQDPSDIMGLIAAKLTGKAKDEAVKSQPSSRSVTGDDARRAVAGIASKPLSQTDQAGPKDLQAYLQSLKGQPANDTMAGRSAEKVDNQEKVLKAPEQQVANIPAPKVQPPATLPVVQVDSSSFHSEVLRYSSTPVLVDFYATGVALAKC